MCLLSIRSYQKVSKESEEYQKSIRRHQNSSELIRTNQKASKRIRRISEVIKRESEGNQKGINRRGISLSFQGERRSGAALPGLQEK